MFRLMTPELARIWQMQETEKSFYWSQACAVVLRKHGLIGLDGAACATQGFPLVTRGQYGDPPDVGLAEGPVHGRHAWGPSGHSRTASSLDWYNVDGHHLGKLCYPQLQIRRIPPDRSVASEPELHRSRDVRWDNTTVQWSSLEAPTGWVPVAFASADNNPDRHVVAVSDGRRLVLGAPLLDLLTATHAFAPLRVGYHTMVRVANQVRVERWLVDQLVEHAVATGSDVVRVHPWPDGFSACLSIRHDYDRVIPMNDLEDVLGRYEARDLQSTWCFRLDNLDRDHARTVLAAGHEVALHTIAPTLERFEDECDQLSDAIGTPVRGSTAHGGLGSTGYLGERQHTWAEATGMHYSEMLGRSNGLPHQALRIVLDIPTPSPVVLPATHLSLDRNTTTEGHYLEWLTGRVPEMLCAGEHAVVMNHPDIHVAELFSLLDALDLEGVWRATLDDVAGWTRAATATSWVTQGAGEPVVMFPEGLPMPARIDFESVPDGRRTIRVPQGATSWPLG